MTPERLMILAENKYKILIERGKWVEKSRKEKKIIALESQIQSMRLNSQNSPRYSNARSKPRGKIPPEVYKLFRAFIAAKAI